MLTAIMGDPLRLAADLAIRAPNSPRAAFGHGHSLLQSSGYEPDSPRFQQAYAVLERASAMPGSSILPEQTLILTQSLMKRPIEGRWWQRMVAKLEDRTPNSEDVGALGALTRCARNKDCELPHPRMDAAFAAAEAHPRRGAQLLTIHGDWAWSVLGDYSLGERYASAAVDAAPSDPDARITLARMNIVLGRSAKAREQVQALERLNVGGHLDSQISDLAACLPCHRQGRDRGTDHRRNRASGGNGVEFRWQPTKQGHTPPMHRETSTTMPTPRRRRPRRRSATPCGAANITDRDAFMGRVATHSRNQWLTNTANGAGVRRAIARYLGVKHCVAMCKRHHALKSPFGHWVDG